VPAGIDQWLFPEQQDYSKVDQYGDPEEQQQADDRYDAHGCGSKVAEFRDSCADSEYPPVFPVTV
jgi:hypothetical protein